MKITPKKVLGTIMDGALGEISSALKELERKTASATENDMVYIGCYAAKRRIDFLDGDDTKMALMVSLLFGEVNALRLEVKKLRKRLESEATDGK